MILGLTSSGAVKIKTDGGTFVLGAVGGSLQWIATEECP